MALTASQIQARIDALQAARDAGVSSVRHGDTQTTWRSVDELNQIIAALQNQLADATGSRRRAKVNYITQGSRGYGCD